MPRIFNCPLSPTSVANKPVDALPHSGRCQSLYDVTVAILSLNRGTAWTATLLLIVLFGLVAAAELYSRSGQTTFETGIVTRFDKAGSRPFVHVRLSNGHTQVLHAESGSLRACAIGRPIRLMRQGQVLVLAPVAC